MKEMFKKFWFIILAGVVMVVGICYFAYDQTQGILPGKQMDGKDVVYSVKDTNVTADEFYDQLFEGIGPASVFQFVQRTVLEESFETTDEMIATAQTNVDTITAQFQSSYGAEYESALLEAIKQVGYDEVADLDDYFLEVAKYEMFTQSVFDDGFDSYSDTLKPRILSHILVMMDDSSNPTEEELAKVEAVEAALESGSSFQDVAIAHSEDGSAEQGGFLGYADVNTSFVPEFLEASLALGDGEVTQWVQTDYGYHLILCHASTLEALQAYPEFYEGIATANPQMIAQGLWDKAQELGITFTDPEVESAVLTYLGLEQGAE